MAYVGEIRWFANGPNSVPKLPSYLLPCNGQSVSQSAFPTLFALIGTTYGSSSPGQFNLPNLTGQVMLGAGTAAGTNTTYAIGQSGGSETVALTNAQTAPHSHVANGQSTTATVASPKPDAVPAIAAVPSGSAAVVPIYGSSSASQPLDPSAVTASPGGGTAHANMQPFITLTAYIQVNGVFPNPEESGSPAPSINLGDASKGPDILAGEIRILATAIVPSGFLPCDGSVIAPSAYPLLAAVIGTTYGFLPSGAVLLPDLRGRLTVSAGTAPSGTSYALGTTGGAETVTLSVANMAPHTHPMQACTGSANATQPAQSYGVVSAGANGKAGLYYPAVDATLQPLDSAFVQSAGAANVAAHDNVMPCLGLRFVIATTNMFVYGDNDAFIGEVRILAHNTLPQGWVTCDGRAVNGTDSSAQLLGAAIGSTFGGTDWPGAFHIPDLRGRTVIGAGAAPGLSVRALGTPYGEASVALNASQIPAHSHTVNVAVPKSPPPVPAPKLQTSPSNSVLVNRYPGDFIYDNYSATAAVTPMAGLIGSTGGAAHSNLQPYAVVNYCICMMSDLYPFPAAP